MVRRPVHHDDGPASSWVAWLRGHERTLWVIALCFYGVGDAITTGIGLWGVEAVEVGPVVAPLVERYGPVGLLAAKGATLAAFYGLWRAISTPKRVAIPFALAVVGTAVTGWNVGVVSTGLAA
ncbi:hypothetical protein Halru_0940 [Halovivax ruber XH-70]|uniref:DUF5658 domain-containing protein n=1 Tax=Halovivax ruber (strain DSM 18193 / JCM 13892 / XH-70) TaxID=797302 RepID=L0I7K7_HALRX|nr:hypothetical protein Halru_0940 [Halovivax ruber XH-70]